MAQDYNATLNLPETAFQMRAGLPQKEPGILAGWEEHQLYQEMVRRNEGKPLYVLHDGPPYANGDIHLGTALNKILKDIIVRSKNMMGYKAPYIPGWDTHGLPIELKARKTAGVDSGASDLELRQICKDYALHYVDVQREQFKRLGVLGDWENPYLTLRPRFEAKQIEIFGAMASKGYIYKGLKPVYWCPQCETALAEAEIEYAEDPCDSIYVKFKVADDKGKLTALGADLAKTYFVIWTTTTWTLPGNLAICLGPDYDYCVVHATEKDEYYVMARELVAATMEAGGIAQYTISELIPGRELEYLTYTHPFMDRVSPIILGEHVTLESGTGCVHTAPGHGVEDFEVCMNHYPEIPVVVPVDNKGRMTAEAGQFAGITTKEANQAILQHLVELDALFAVQKIIHQYPHCWRCKEPVLFRATEQWFCSVDGFKEDAIRAIEEVKWIPAWGEGRIKNMVSDRSDWCISRQRIWGVPIPIFYCQDCGQYHIDEASIQAVAELFRQEGSDAWYTHEASDILPEGTACKKCGGKKFRKEKDIMDVWFDSGSTHASVLEEHGLPWPCDLYIEGADQYRGWFQSSLLTAVATRGKSPYKNCCSCGWVVDGEGKKMSKSLKNGTAPEKIIEQYGADILRLWVASSDYHSDVRISFEYLKQLSDGYRKIRNTARYILGNLKDFQPDLHQLPFQQLHDIDKWAIASCQKLIGEVRAAYEAFEFHDIYHAIHNFCAVDMSSFYLDVLKDRLYVEKKDGPDRRAAQTAIYQILCALDLMLAPILPYTAEEIWSFIPESKAYNRASVMLNDMPEYQEGLVPPAFMEKWERLHAIRDDVNKALEAARTAKTIGKSLEAKVVLHCSEEACRFLAGEEKLLPTIFIVSEVALTQEGSGAFSGEVEGITVDVSAAQGEKCQRCWMQSETVGKDEKHPTLCARCAAILSE
ncbi:MAG: isoleucine--tRNA ligase [Angelakisella sp.]|jgi:isoleucyl-tRNA synthetase|nr:isoleucine--tRNA ligase [Angelakisella sp.]